MQRGSSQSIFKRLACAQLVCVQLALPTVFAQGTADLESALNGYERKLEERKLTEQDVAQIGALVEKNPSNAKAHLVLGLALDYVGLNDQALEQFVAADKLGPQDPKALVGKLHHLLSRGDKVAARITLDEAMKRFPDNPDVLLLMGRTMKDDRNYEGAEKALWAAYNAARQAANRDPGKMPLGLPSQLAELYIASNPELAIRLANEDLARVKDAFMAQAVVGVAYTNHGEYRKALPYLGQIYTKSPTWRNTAEGYSRCLYWDGQYQKAIQPALFSLAKAAGAMGGKPRPQYLLSELFSHVKDSEIEKEIQGFYKVVGMDKDAVNVVKPPFHYYLAVALSEAKKPSLAMKELNTFLQFDPSCFDAILLKGKLQEIYLNDPVGALASYRLAHALLPYSAPCTQALNRLEGRMESRDTDLAWKLKDFLNSIFVPRG